MNDEISASRNPHRDHTHRSSYTAQRSLLSAGLGLRLIAAGIGAGCLWLVTAWAIL